MSEPEIVVEPETEWAIVEIMGHRRHVGRVREEERFGAKMLRIDVPTITVAPPAEEGGEPVFTVDRWTSHWYSGNAIFSFVLTDEATALRINRPYYAPQRYLPRSSEPDPDPDIDPIEADDVGGGP